MVSHDDIRFSHTTFFNTQRSLSVNTRGLPGRDFVVVVSSRFHFTITSPTVDLGNLRRAEMALTDCLLTWQPITIPRSKSLNSLAPPILSVSRSTKHRALCLLL
ncbi:hypothetical protein L798_07820 [Zootermopsis nevadensis]|uniref:Uncharacterized protein n=1 Tax=Zootermopsis nevadensis TaxID=136037 RepID=A0A067R6P8_ZOONE|nr:hypothetical protein L798_07820 [Zootermopsis nevadensis]